MGRVTVPKQREGEVRAPEEFAQGGRDIGGIARQSDASGGDGDRGAEDELEDEEEREQASPAACAVDFLEVLVGPSGAGHGRTEFGPDQSVGERQDGPGDPSVDGLRAVHGGHHERQSGERAHADHVHHVERRGGPEGQSARQFGTGGVVRRAGLWGALHRPRIYSLRGCRPKPDARRLGACAGKRVGAKILSSPGSLHLHSESHGSCGVCGASYEENDGGLYASRDLQQCRPDAGGWNGAGSGSGCRVRANRRPFGRRRWYPRAC